MYNVYVEKGLMNSTTSFDSRHTSLRDARARAYRILAKIPYWDDYTMVRRAVLIYKNDTEVDRISRIAVSGEILCFTDRVGSRKVDDYKGVAYVLKEDGGLGRKVLEV